MSPTLALSLRACLCVCVCLVLLCSCISGEGVLTSRFAVTAPEKWGGECGLLQKKRCVALNSYWTGFSVSFPHYAD